ncbi:MAG: 16S rRNA (cytidine(1402)-2'-O)-methyltransferase [Clostridiales bacterium]|nr:16S rRNA (cytidine(1402)-2'-O)-methyltransferase [Clostridiales bacterium]
MSGTLYVVGTPIGNLGDLSPRAAQTLRDVDFIACEDTRVTARIVNHLGIKKPLVSYHEHNRFERADTIAERLLAGEDCALATDAGMPAISDPGSVLVDVCRKRGVEVVAVPGPTALATAVAVSGIDCSRFTFEGFLSVNKPSRREHLDSLRDERRAMVFYEAPHKLSRTLRDMADVFGDRDIALCRELTKVYEDVERTTLFAAAEKYASETPKGEFVLIVGGKTAEASAMTAEDAVALAGTLMREQGLSVSDAARIASKRSGVSKSDIYDALVNSKRGEDRQ